MLMLISVLYMLCGLAAMFYGFFSGLCLIVWSGQLTHEWRDRIIAVASIVVGALLFSHGIGIH
jgi:hypothetical protein